MSTRRQGVPALTDPALTLADLRVHLGAWRTDSDAAASALQTLRLRVEEHARMLESPKAVHEYIDVFIGRFSRVATELGRVHEALGDQPSPELSQLLRQIAADAQAEGRRVVGFRDKWINKPLPYEQVRPLLTEIATTVRDQLTDYNELSVAASRLDAMLLPDRTEPTNPSHPEPHGFDRRALFSRVLRPDGDRRE